MSIEKEIEKKEKMLKHYQGVARQWGAVYSESVKDAQRAEEELRELREKQAQAKTPRS